MWAPPEEADLEDVAAGVGPPEDAVVAPGAQAINVVADIADVDGDGEGQGQGQGQGQGGEEAMDVAPP